MRVAVLCPGPSLATTSPVEWQSADVLIGVNSVPQTFACHWWAMLDEDCFWLFQAVGQPRILLTDHAHDRLLADARSWHDYPKHPPGLKASELESTLQPPANWQTYTTLAALALTAHLGATEVVIYGADMDGQRDYRGREGGHRDAQRWAEESTLFAELVRWLEAKNIRVQRFCKA